MEYFGDETDVRKIFVNLLAPGRCGINFKSVIFELIVQNSSLGTHHEITFRWMPHNLTNEKSVLAQVMAWCHYLNQYWPRSMLSCGITRP